MGHLTLRMISIAATSFMIFGLAQAEHRAERQLEDQEQESLESQEAKKEKEKKTEERFRAEQAIQRAMRDQGMVDGSMFPAPPPPPPPPKVKR